MRLILIGILMITNLASQILQHKFFDIDTDIIAAIGMVESDGVGWLNDKIKIRFENHIFLANCPEARKYFLAGEPSYSNHFFLNDEKWVFTHTSQKSEHQALDLAKTLCFTEAFNSISIGTFQLHTVNHTNIGFPSGFLMYAYMSESQEREIEIFSLFVKKNKPLYQAMKDKNLEDIAFYWNPHNPFWLDEFIKAYEQLKSD